MQYKLSRISTQNFTFYLFSNRYLSTWKFQCKHFHINFRLKWSQKCCQNFWQYLIILIKYIHHIFLSDLCVDLYNTQFLKDLGKTWHVVDSCCIYLKFFANVVHPASIVYHGEMKIYLKGEIQIQIQWDFWQFSLR